MKNYVSLGLLSLVVLLSFGNTVYAEDSDLVTFRGGHAEPHNYARPETRSEYGNHPYARGYNRGTQEAENLNGAANNGAAYAAPGAALPSSLYAPATQQPVIISGQQPLVTPSVITSPAPMIVAPQQ